MIELPWWALVLIVLVSWIGGGWSLYQALLTDGAIDAVIALRQFGKRQPKDR